MTTTKRVLLFSRSLFTFAVAHDVAHFFIKRGLFELSLVMILSEVWMGQMRLILNVLNQQLIPAVSIGAKFTLEKEVVVETESLLIDYLMINLLRRTTY